MSSRIDRILTTHVGSLPRSQAVTDVVFGREPEGQRDLARAGGVHTGAVAAIRPQGAFMNAASPGVIALFQPNDFYPTQDAYLEALANALAVEYEAIVKAGIILQI